MDVSDVKASTSSGTVHSVVVGELSPVKSSSKNRRTIIYKHSKTCGFNPLTRISQFFGVAFLCTQSWLYNACLDKTFPSSRNASPILIQLALFYSPLNSRSDGSNHQSLQGNSPSSARYKSFISFLFRVFHYTLVQIGP